MKEKIINKNQLEHKEIKRKSYKEIIKNLYNLFIPNLNPNHPRNRELLINLKTKDSFTVNFLAYKLGISEDDVIELFENIPGCEIEQKENKPAVIIFVSFDDFEKFIQKEYERLYVASSSPPKLILKNKTHPAILKENLETKINPAILKKDLETKTHPDVLKEDFSLEKFLSPSEIKFLKLILEHNPSGIFALNVLHIPRKLAFNKDLAIEYPDVPFIYSSPEKRMELINKCLTFGLIERYMGQFHKFKFKEQTVTKLNQINL
ncbi:MAG: hypothetical protein ACP5QN_00925 [Minisyncoccia bacterium]